MIDFPGSPQINNCLMSLRNVSDTFDQGHRGVTPLCHSTAGHISEIKRAEKLVVTWTVLYEDPRKCMLIVPCQQWPAPYMRLPIMVAAPINPFMSKAENDTHFAGASEGNSCSSMCFFFLCMPRFFGEFPKSRP